MDQNSNFESPSQPKNFTNQKDIIPVVEEQLQVIKETVETGAMRISKKVHEEEVTVNVPITYNEHDVERVAVNKFVNAPPPIRYEGNTMIIPILEEEVVLEKKLRLVEELRVTGRQVQTSSSQQVTLLREELTVQHTSEGAARSSGNPVEIKIIPTHNEE